MKLLMEQTIFAQNVGKLIDFIYSNDHSCTLGDAYRTPEQAALYAKQGKGIVNSLHCKRLAIDLNIFNSAQEYLTQSDDYRTFGEYWESLHHQNRWGGKFTKADGNHFQMNED